ncbi:hypothetical protein FPHYL_240, partial [Fusarium phyllophilum]
MTLFTMQNLITSALFLSVAQAETNSTSGNTTMVGWVSPAPRRSTWSIIWSCLSIFIVCSWKCVHLNIPTHEEIQGEWHTIQLCRGLPDVSFWPKAPLRRKWRRKIIWMTFIALAPEFGVAIAARQYREARRELKEFKQDISNEYARKFTMAHSFYVQMGGVVIFEPSPHSSPIEENSASNLQSNNEMSNAAHYDSQVVESSQPPDSTGHGILLARMPRYLSDVKHNMLRIPESEIKDLSKADVITKAFAITQCTWLVVQSLSRVAHGYAISLLELATLAFIFCAFIMHIFWWNKPFDVESRRVVTEIAPGRKVTASLDYLSMDDLVVSDSEIARERISDLSWSNFLVLIFEPIGVPVGDILSIRRPFPDYLPSISLYIASTTFLAIHLAAWNWEFPSPVVKSLWRWLNLGTLVASFIPLIGSAKSHWVIQADAIDDALDMI